MEQRNLNLQLMDFLMGWDPLGYGVDAYETERVDILQAVHELNNVKALAERIQAVIEFSFEEIVPLSVCLTTATQLLQMKNADTSCSIN